MKQTITDTENEGSIDESQIKNKISLLADSNDEDPEGDKNDVKVQLKMYKNQKYGASKDEDPIIRWKQNQIGFPAVAAKAMKYLSIVATSVSSEHLFDQTVLVISK